MQLHACNWPSVSFCLGSFHLIQLNRPIRGHRSKTRIFPGVCGGGGGGGGWGGGESGANVGHFQV